jgi:hypothetical protein
MIAPETELMRREIQLARRLARLFRIERSGHLMRRPVDTARRLIDRRELLIAELTQLEERRRLLAPRVSSELDPAMAALAQETERCEQHCLEVLAEIGAKVSRLRGAGTATGLRDSADGRLLGRG